MLSKYSDRDKDRAILTLQSVSNRNEKSYCPWIFELDADLVFDAVKEEIPILKLTVEKAISDIKANK